jgi:4-hydroxy-4-methyl-2-oxoglutarate aldolase
VTDDRCSVGFRVFTRVERPAPDVLALFRSLETTNLADAMHGMHVLDGGIRPLILPQSRIVGPALTCSISPGNGFMIRKAIEIAQAGDVLVVNGFGNLQRAVVGGNVLISMAAKGIVALVLDGVVRDLDEARRVGLAVYARGSVPRAGTNPQGRGEVNVPIACGGVAVLPGDVVVADEDGVVVVPRADAAAVAAHAARVQQQKGSAADFDQRWAAARAGHTPPSIDPLLREQGCAIL